MSSISLLHQEKKSYYSNLAGQIFCYYSLYYYYNQLYQLGTGGRTQKAKPVRGAYEVPSVSKVI